MDILYLPFVVVVTLFWVLAGIYGIMIDVAHKKKEGGYTLQEQFSFDIEMNPAPVILGYFLFCILYVAGGPITILIRTLVYKLEKKRGT